MYWKERGPANTAATIEAALKRAGELKISRIVVASNSGATAERLYEAGKGLNIVCVTHHVGSTGPGEDEMPAEMRSALKKKGVAVLTTTHLLAGVDRGLRNKFQGVYPLKLPPPCECWVRERKSVWRWRYGLDAGDPMARIVAVAGSGGATHA